VTAPVGIAFNDAGTRAALTLFHATGNIITAAMVDALSSALDDVARSPHVKLVTISGAGADFSFGASIPEHAPDRIAAVLPAMHSLIEQLLDAPAPTAAVVRGRCLGGGFELALACDLIFAADGAEFGLPEIALGVFPPAAAALLAGRVGGARATRAILTGESRSADEWQRAGLIELLAPARDLEVAVDRWFEIHFAPRSAAALRHAAAAARYGLLAHVRATLPALERLYLNDLMQTHDAAEGIAAFLAKRPPQWSDD
jgi:cyclohexa-1,5-dienecarbonyl-CoA hydratase